MICTVSKYVSSLIIQLSQDVDFVFLVERLGVRVDLTGCVRMNLLYKLPYIVYVCFTNLLFISRGSIRCTITPTLEPILIIPISTCPLNHSISVSRSRQMLAP
jgi:hypothetical protein